MERLSPDGNEADETYGGGTAVDSLAEDETIDFITADLPPVPRAPDLRWPAATGKDVRHARTPPPGVPAARGAARP